MLIIPFIISRFFPHVIDTFSLQDDVITVLKRMNSTDFDKKNGINEAGFKAIVLSTLINSNAINPDKIHSEYKITTENNKNGYIDIFIEFDKAVYVIELKYVKIDYVNIPHTENNYKLSNRVKLSMLANSLKKVDDVEFSIVDSVDQNGTYNTRSTEIQEYKKLVKKQSHKYVKSCLTKYSSSKIISEIVMIGIGNKVYMDRSYHCTDNYASKFDISKVNNFDIKNINIYKLINIYYKHKFLFDILEILYIVILLISITFIWLLF